MRAVPPAWVSSGRPPPGLSPAPPALLRSPGAGQAAAGSSCRARTSPLRRHLLWAMAAAWGRWARAWLCRCELTHPQTPKGGPSFGPSNPTLVPLCRTAWQGCCRNYRAALCAELKRPLVIEEVAPRPVQPHEVGDWPGPWTPASPRPPPMTRWLPSRTEFPCAQLGGAHVAGAQLSAGLLDGPFPGSQKGQSAKGRLFPKTHVEGPRAVALETENSDLHTTLHSRLQVIDLTQINDPILCFPSFSCSI